MLPSGSAAKLTRRAFLHAGTGLVTASLVAGGPHVVWAASGVHSFEVGASEVIVISDGVFSLPRSLVLPDTPQPDIDALFKAHGASAEIVAQTNVTVVRTGSNVVLIDTGAGPDFMPSLGSFTDKLEGLGIQATDVTHVVFTHAHADHFWGVLDPFGDGSRWPDARHVMTTVERDFWLAAGVEDRVPAFQKSMAIGIQRRLKSLAEKMTFVASSDEILPGIALIPSPGHTPGHVSVAVRSGTSEIVVLGDALTHPAVSFGAPQWRWGSDLDAAQAAATRVRLLDDLSTRKVGMIGYHLPWPGVGRAERRDSAYRYIAE